MSSSLRHVLISIGIVVLAFLAHGRLLQAHLLGDDLGFVHDSALAAEGGGAAALAAGGHERLVPGAIHWAIARALADEPLDSGARPLVLRATSFVLLLLAALATGLAVRRALRERIGGDPARAAGFASALFFAVHPFAGAAIGRPRGLAELCVWLLGVLSAFLFLRGRQEREKVHVVLAGVAAVAAGFSSASAWLLPFVLAGLEYGSVRRPRPTFERLRTTLTTWLVFAACVLVERAVEPAFRTGPAPSLAQGFTEFAAWSEPALALASGIEKLGLLFFPVTGGAASENWPSYLVCIAILLIALWPLLRGARVAPRLWGRLAATWIAALCLALVPQVSVDVGPANGSAADLLVIPSSIAAIGLAVAATSLLGTRRIVLPALIGILTSWLAMRSAGQYESAARAVDGLRTDVAAARSLAGEGGTVVVLDAPERAAGLVLGVRGLEARLSGRATREPLWIPAGALALLTRTQEFAERRRAGVVILANTDRARGPLRDVLVVRPTEGTEVPPWRAESRSGFLQLDPSTVRFARVQALPRTSTAEAPRIAWRASEPAGEWTIASGVWVEGEAGPVGVFEPWRETAWWSASTIRRVRGEDPLHQVALFELVPDLPLVLAGGAPRVDGSDWVFEIPEASLARPLRGTPSFVLEILGRDDTRALVYRRLDCAATSANGLVNVRARGAAGATADLRGAEPPCVWSLERRVGEVAIARAEGRLAR